MGQSGSRIVDIKNDFELVIRDSKELEHLLETHFQAPSGKTVGLHEKIGAARTRSGEPLTENAVRRMRYLVTIRNSLVHDREVNAIPNRADFVKGWAEVEAELQRLIPQERKKGKRSFLMMMMIRQLLALVTLGMVLSKQPFMVRPRESGKNAFKMKPLDVAIAGAVHWAATSPMVLKNPKYAEYINMTARALLTPHEYVSAQQSKRAMPAEQTITGAYKKTEKVFQRTVDKDTNVLEMLKLPLMAPNMVLLGSYVLILGSILSVLSGSIFEYVVITGCVLVLQGSRSFGMEPQPELYVAGGAAVLGLLAMEASAPKAEPKKRKKK